MPDLIWYTVTEYRHHTLAISNHYAPSSVVIADTTHSVQPYNVSVTLVSGWQFSSYSNSGTELSTSWFDGCRAASFPWQYQQPAGVYSWPKYTGWGTPLVEDGIIENNANWYTLISIITITSPCWNVQAYIARSTHRVLMPWVQAVYDTTGMAIHMLMFKHAQMQHYLKPW